MPSPIQPGATISGFRSRPSHRQRLMWSRVRGDAGIARAAACSVAARRRRSRGVRRRGPLPRPAARSRRVPPPGCRSRLRGGRMGRRGRFVATRFVRGQTLERVLGAGATSSRGELIAVIDQVESTVTAAHGVGLVHGRISARNVIIEEDGRVLLTDLGLGAERSADDDRAAIAGLRERAELAPRARPGSGRAPPLRLPGSRRPRRWLSGPGSSSGPDQPGGSGIPSLRPRLRRGRAAGSELAAGSSSIGCARRPA